MIMGTLIQFRSPKIKSSQTEPPWSMTLWELLLLACYFKQQTLWSESVSELYRLNDRGLSAKLAPTFVDRQCHVVSVTDPYGHILGFIDQSRYFFFQVTPHLYSRGWVDSVPDLLLFRKLVTPEFEPGCLEPGTLTTRPQRWTHVTSFLLILY
jgi:hypothetical protein